MAESRIQKSLLNAKVNLIFYALTLALSFFSRKIFLNCLGADFVGLTGTLQNLLGFLNLAELGIGAAIGYVLYKPLFDKDQPKITEIISVFGYLYSRIGYLILAGGILLSCFLPLIFPKTGFQWGVIYFAFYAFLFSSLIGYFCNYKQTLLGADQKNYVVTAYFQSANILKTLIQMGSAWYTGSFYLWIIIEVIFGITYSIILNWKIKQVYPWLTSEVSLGRALFKKYPEVMKHAKQLFLHQLGNLAQFQAIPFIVYLFTSLQIVAFYGNYMIIIDKISALINTFLGSTSAGIGNLIANGNSNKIKNIFWILVNIRMFAASLICTSLFILINPFIILWLGESYLLNNSVVMLIILNCAIRYTCGATNQFLYGYGIFWDVWAPVVEFLANTSISLLGGYFWGLPGVLSGGIVSLLLIPGLWKPYLLFRWGFKDHFLNYWKKFTKSALMHIVPGLICILSYYYFSSFFHIDSYTKWVTVGIFLIIIHSLITFILISFFSKDILHYISKVILPEKIIIFLNKIKKCLHAQKS